MAVRFSPFSVDVCTEFPLALPRRLSLVACNDSPTPANPLSSLTALPVPPLDRWLCGVSLLQASLRAGEPKKIYCLTVTRERRRGGEAEDEGGRPVTHESTFAGAAR